MGLASEQAVQVLAIKARETMEIKINSLAMEFSNKTTSLGIKITQNSLMEVNNTSLRQALISGIRRCASGRLIQSCRLSRST